MKLVFLILLMIGVSCTPKGPDSSAESEGSPKQWRQWTKSLSKKYKEPFSSPSITHHIYLKNPGEKVFLNTSGSYARFQRQCEDCPLAISLQEDAKVFIHLPGQKDPVELPMEKPTSVLSDDQFFLSAYHYKDDGRVRVFVHDLKQSGIEKIRNRDFFDYSPEYKIESQWQWLDKPKDVTIQRSDGSSKTMQKVALLKGRLLEKPVELSVYNFASDDSYKDETATMLLYRDYSNGKKTYGAGRFLNVEFPKKIKQLNNGDSVSIDFNYSYNPPCAVSTGFHCPLPQDMVKASVKVGEAYNKPSH